MVSLPASISLSGGAAVAHIADGTATTRYPYHSRRSPKLSTSKTLVRICTRMPTCRMQRWHELLCPSLMFSYFIYSVACLFMERRPECRYLRSAVCDPRRRDLRRREAVYLVGVGVRQIHPYPLFGQVCRGVEGLVQSAAAAICG